MDWRQCKGLFHPEDGTSPFYARSDDQGADYDSDDEYTTDILTLHDFGPSTSHQTLKSRTKPVNCFIIKQYIAAPPRAASAKFGFATEGADTAISLSPDDGDLILVRSEMLAASHPFFRVSIAARWPHNKLSHPVVIDGQKIFYRYDLEFYGDGSTALIGKKKPTPADERGWKISEAANIFRQSLHGRKTAYDMFDEYGLKFIAIQSKDLANSEFGFPAYEHICKSAHYLALELLCGYPATLYRRRPQHGEDTAVLILLKLMEWMHVYGSLNALGPQIERLILGPKFGKPILLQYPYTCLRITNLIRGKELFKAALEYAVSEFDTPR